MFATQERRKQEKDFTPSSENRTAQGGAVDARQINHSLGSTQFLQRYLGNSGMQPKLAVGPVNDVYERVADRVAGQVMRIPDAVVQSEYNHLTAGVNIRRISDGGGDGLNTGLDVQLRQRGGCPLSASTRKFMEPRFGADFGHIRLHTDDRSAKLARAVSARAFTVGRDVVFGAGEYSPETRSGQFLIAHELAHTIQQSGSDRYLQRFVTCESPEACPPRVSGESGRSRRDAMSVGSVSNADTGMLVSNFAIGSSSIKPDLSSNPTWLTFLGTMSADTARRWEILGFSDCHGSEASNQSARRGRADAVNSALPGAARSQVDTVGAAPLANCMAENTDERGRALNRSAFIRLRGYAFPGETITASPPAFVCGPDVTSQIATALSNVRSRFAGWTSAVKEGACDSLDSLRTGSIAWDIVQLHTNAWIHRNYRPTCATVGATPPCGSSVQVGNQCYYAGSANYVVFGVMCKLCFDHYLSILNASGINRFRRSGMLRLINYYKGTGFSGLATPAANFAESRQWANAGYDGWPSGGTPPPGDRSNCSPLCPTPYSGAAFIVRWHPHIIQ